MHLAYCKRRQACEAIQGGGVGAEGPELAVETLVATRDDPVEGPPFRSREGSDHHSHPHALARSMHKDHPLCSINTRLSLLQFATYDISSVGRLTAKTCYQHHAQALQRCTT
jgi:hypothetical protein